MTLAPPRALVDRYLDLALAGDSGSAVDLALETLELGGSPAAFVTGVLVPAQREVGNRWHRDEIGVADEHIATGTAAAVVHALSRRVPVPAGPARVVLGCAEGDWHSMTTQLLAVELRTLGIGVTVLGASTPAAHLARFLERYRPDAFAVSCSLPLFYGGVARLADAAHRHGVPVLAGGRASTAERVRLLGADGWAADSFTAGGLITQWAFRRPDVSTAPTRLDPGGAELDMRAGELSIVALAGLVREFPGMRTDQIARTREDLAFIVAYVAAAKLVGDPAVLIEFLDWLEALLRVRHVPGGALTAGLEALRPLIWDVDPEAGRLADLGLEHLAVGS